MSVFDSICHPFSSVSIGGFPTQAESIGAFEGFIIPFIVIISCIMGSTSFALYPEFFKNPKMLINNLQFRYFCIIAIIGIPIYLLTLSNDIESFIIQFSDAGFQVFSALTTAGFSTVDL
ncbi:MAG: potassium transporter TrkG [Methanohalobium sp.]|uniref:potassium transporter TrkG n=1 Tax=Methanohalobium sp. TaxID=2837493 RepID=UPI00397BC08D